MTTKDVSFPNHFTTKPFFARLVLAMALSNKAVLVNLFLNDSLELIMVISDVELQAANKQGSKEKISFEMQ